MPSATEIPTLAGTMDELARRGFTEHFILVNGKLRAADSGKVFPPFVGRWPTPSVSTRIRWWARS